MVLENNQFGIILKDPKIRQKAFKSFCDHLAKGKSIKSWWYDEDEHLCCWATMVSYIKNNPKEFDAIKKTIAETKGFAHWESVVEASADGKNKDANTASLQMLMRNKYGWDKEDHKKQTTNYTINLGKDGLGVGLRAETLSDTDHKSSE